MLNHGGHPDVFVLLSLKTLPTTGQPTGWDLHQCWLGEKGAHSGGQHLSNGAARNTQGKMACPVARGDVKFACQETAACKPHPIVQ